MTIVYVANFTSYIIYNYKILSRDGSSRAHQFRQHHPWASQNISMSLYKDPPEAITYYYSTPWKWIVIELRTLRKQLNRDYPPLIV